MGAFLSYGRASRNAQRLRPAAILFGLALIPIGLSRIFYPVQTAWLVPACLPFHRGCAYFTGAAELAAGFGVLFAVVPALAATLESAALTVFTILGGCPVSSPRTPAVHSVRR